VQSCGTDDFTSYNSATGYTRCLKQCDEQLPYQDMILWTCNSACPDERPFSTPTETTGVYNCTSSCNSGMYKILSSGAFRCVSECTAMTWNDKKRGSIACITECPADAPYDDGFNCVEHCPEKHPYVNAATLQCMATCGSYIELDGNMICGGRCPAGQEQSGTKCVAEKKKTDKRLVGIILGSIGGAIVLGVAGWFGIKHLKKIQKSKEKRTVKVVKMESKLNSERSQGQSRLKDRVL